MSKTMWMVRSEGGRLADDFVEKKVVAIGWEEIGDLAQYKNKAAILEAIRKVRPEWGEGRLQMNTPAPPISEPISSASRP